MNGINIPVKKQRLSEAKQNRTQLSFVYKKPTLKINRLKVKG